MPITTTTPSSNLLLLPLSKYRLFTTSPPSFATTDQSKTQGPIGNPATAPIPPEQQPEQPEQPPTTEPTPVDQPQTPHRRRSRAIYYSAVFLLAGLSFGTLLRLTLSPPPLPAPGSPEDLYLISKIQARGSHLPLVRALSSDPAWTSWDAYSGLEAAVSTHTQPISVVRSRITSGPLSGSNGLAFQRIFHNSSTGEVVSVVYFGPSTAGWPGIVHGGALATVLDESLGRCAILQFPARTGVTARLELTYRSPTITSDFYVVRTRPIVREGEIDPAKTARKMWVEGTLETEHGRVCVEAKALFVVPKGVKLKPLVEGF